MSEIDEILTKAKQALEANDPENAGHLLVPLLEEPEGKPLAEIRALLERAAAANHTESQLHLAIMQLQGHGGSMDADAAVKLLAQVVELDASPKLLGRAHTILGECYVRGNGVPADETVAFRHYQQAAEHGEAQAAFAVGLCYDEGVLSQELDVPSALKYYAQAAKVGHVQAMSNIVLLYMSGKAPLPLDEAVKDLLEGGVQTEDVATAELIRASQTALVEWLKEMGAY